MPSKLRAAAVRKSSPVKGNLGDAQLEPSTEIKLLGEDSEARIRFHRLIGTISYIQITGRGLTAIRANLG